MNRNVFLGISYVLLSSYAFAKPTVAVKPTVTLSGPTPALAASYNAGLPSTVVYTITNNVPHKRFPVQVTGIYGEIQRTPVENDCGDLMPAGPSVCNIGITMTPSSNSNAIINQTMVIHYHKRTTFKVPITFSVGSTYAYVTPFPSSSIINNCPIDTSTGEFLSCLTAYDSQAIQQYGKLIFATVNGTQYAYIAGQSQHSLFQCTIDTNGGFDLCTSTVINNEDGVTFSPGGIAFAMEGPIPYIYVGNNDIGGVNKCQLNKTTGAVLNPCTSIPTTSSVGNPYGLAFANVNNASYAYITNFNSGIPVGKIFKCDANFTSCSDIPATQSLGVPYAIAFNTSVAGTQYAYVADNGDSANSILGKVYKCPLNSTGGFDEPCTATPDTLPSNAVTTWYPYDIAFATIQGTQYAYVACSQGTSLGGMFVCKVLRDGSFGTCTQTPNPAPQPTDFRPISVAFRF